MTYDFQRMSTMKRIIFLLVLALPLFLLLSRDSGQASETKRDQRPIFIAIIAPFSGPLAECGLSMLRGARLREDQGGDQSYPHGKALKLIALDDRGEPARARQLAERITSNPLIVAVVGHLTTGCTLSAMPFYHAARLTTVSPVATGNDLDTVKSPYLFRTILSDRQQALSLARYIHKTMGKVTVALVYEDSVLGAQLKNAFLLKGQELGLSVKSFSMGSNPFAGLSDALHKIALLGPEVIFSAGGLRSTALILKKWPEGIDKPLIFGTYRLISEEFRELVGDQQRGIMAAHPSIWTSDSQRGAEIRGRYEKHWKYRMDWLAAQTYDAVDLLFWAIRESGSSLKSLRDVLMGLDSKKHALPVLAGPLYFNRNGSLARGVTVAEYIDGRWTLTKAEAVSRKQ
jgi:ABC-type branched-subunit amino acid transport system substrate-binding protein